jgi:hypothetical protein
MSQRSPYNDRSRVEQKGKTRKSAAASRPKREAGASASSSPSKKAPAKKRTLWGRGPAREPVAPLVQTPEMRRLRRIWWGLWSASLIIAVGILALQQGAAANPAAAPLLDRFLPFLWGLWVASLGGAFYLELGPLRKARAAAIAEAKSAGGKKGAKKAPAVDPSAPERKSMLAGLGGLFRRSRTEDGVVEVPDTDAGAKGAGVPDEDGDE